MVRRGSPRNLRNADFQNRFSDNVWAGTDGNHLIGTYNLPPQLTAAAYLDFLNSILGNLLEDVPLGTCMWYLHDGVSAHYAGEVPTYVV